MRRSLRYAAMVLTAAAVIVMTGCSSANMTTQAEAKKAAKERWANARSNIMYSMAVQQFEVGDLDKSEKTIAQAISMSPENPAYLDLAARIYLERGHLERAFHTVEQSINLDAERSESHYIMGLIFQRWQQYEPAYKEYKLAYEARPDDVSPLLAMGEMLVKLNRPDEAITLLSAKLKYFDHNPAIRVGLGRIYMLKRDMPKAVALLREATLLAPEDKTVLEQLTMAEYAAGRWPDAIDHLKALLADKNYADRADLHSALGDCYLATQRPLEARRVFMELTREHPNDVNAWIKLAECAWAVEDNVRLSQATRQVLSLSPDRHEGYLLRGMMEMRTGNKAKALPWFDRAASLATNNASPLIMKGMTLEQMGRPAEAAAAYRQALTVAPDDTRAQRLLAGVDTR
ncbi:tetratricopeptide repeat protein [Planctomycetales bacterium ZRK34]|nr:tetratricopeptide repeat protein [Planctomycetales bacterium ZRK34]